MNGSAVLADRSEGEDVPRTEDGADTPPARPGGSRVSASFLFGALAALWGLVMGMGSLSDNSFLTHLATGRLILDGGGVPQADPYSFTAAGDPWVVQSWLASLVYALIEEVAGLGGVRLLQGLLGAALGAMVWIFTDRSQSIFVRIGVTGGVLAAAAGAWSGRPLLFGLLGLAAVVLAADGRIDPRWLVPVVWVWVNTHGSFPFALLLVVLYAVGGRLDHGRWGEAERRTLVWTAVGIALGALNPLGPRLLVFPLLVTQKREAFQQVIEWQPPSYERPSEVLLLGLLLLAVLGLVRVPRWRDALPLVVFGGLALTAQRNAAPLLLIMTPVLAAAVPRLGRLAPSLSRRAAVGAGVVMAALALLVASSLLGAPDTELEAYPVSAVAWMEDNGLWGEDARVVSNDFVGNYREFLRGREARVFFDDRVDMYPVELVRDYRVLFDAAPSWPEVLARHRATAVLWRVDTPLGGALARDEGWRIVHEDDTWLVAVAA